MIVLAVALGVWIVVLAAGFVMSRWQPRSWANDARVPASLFWVGLVAAVAAGAVAIRPPGATDSPAPAAFSVDRAQEYIAVLAQEPHPMGSAAIDDVRHVITSELQGLGLDPEFQEVPASDYYGGSDAVVPVVNVIARIQGMGSTGAVALVAHYDTFPVTPGANDNASGVAVVLETARSLLAGEALRNDVVLVFTDGEEPAPRFGSTAFVAEHRFAGEIRFVINLEAIGSGGSSLLTEMNGPDRWVLDHYVASTPHPAAFSFLTETTELIGGSNTDFAPFRDAGISGVEFVYARGSSIYHTAADTPDRVSRRSLEAHGANTLGLTRDLAQTDLSAVGDGERMVFFTVGRHVIRYPASWSVPLVAVAGVLLLSAAWRRTDWTVAARGALTALASAVAIALVAGVLWMILAGWRSHMGVAESFAYLCGLSALVAVALTIPFLSRPGIGTTTERLDILLVWWMLGLVTAVAVPGASYLFAWPALVGALTLRFGPAAGDGWRQLGPATLTLGVAAVALVPAIDTFFQVAQPRPGNPDSELLPAVVIPMLLVALVIQLVLAFRVRCAVCQLRARERVG